MSLYVTPKQSILDAANTLNGTSLLLTDIAFETPKVAPDDVVTTTGKNTQVRINGNGKTWTGTVVVNYNRLKLSDIITLTSNTLRVAALTSTLEVMNYLNYFYGMLLTTDDIKDEPVTLNEDGSGTVTINAKPDSYGWIGSVTLNLVKGDAIVDFAVTDLSLDGIDYPTKQFAKGQGPLVAYPYDFTASKDFIAAQAVGNTLMAGTSSPGSQLAAILTTAINNASFAWGATATAAVRNLHQSKVIYNGLNSAEFASNQDYKYVMMVQLSDGTAANGVVGTFCTDFVGVLYFHYNDPIQ